MDFSIITPSYNQGKFIQKCLDSVRSQKNVTLEHIVVDAGSKDETLEILGRQTFAAWTSEPDKGMSDGINKGFLKGKGKWLMWLNCDDYLLPNALESVLAHAEKNPDADMIHGDCVFVDTSGNVIRRKYDTPTDEFDLLFVGCCIPSTSSFYKNTIIEQGHLLDITYKNCMDWEYYLRLIRLGYKLSYLPKALAGFCWHEESTTQQFQERAITEGKKCVREHLDLKGYPDWLGSDFTLPLLRRLFQIRRVGKRICIHKKIV